MPIVSYYDVWIEKVHLIDIASCNVDVHLPLCWSKGVLHSLRAQRTNQCWSHFHIDMILVIMLIFILQLSYILQTDNIKHYILFYEFFISYSWYSVKIGISYLLLFSKYKKVNILVKELKENSLTFTTMRYLTM